MIFPSQMPIPFSQPPLSITSVKALLAEAEAKLRAQGISTPRLDAEALLAHTLETDRTHLFARFSSLLTPARQEAFRRKLERRMQREPLAYITGVREFWSLDFRVTPDVLIPRPETEILVETTSRLVAQKNAESSTLSIRVPSPLEGEEQEGGNDSKVLIRHPLLSPPPSRGRRTEDFASHLTILDVGTGSGCIAISLAKELPAAELWAVDVSQTALVVALENARRHHVDKRIRFLQSDLFSSIHEETRYFDLIVSNPPYIAHPDLAVLQPEIRDWEPREALDGGRDGLDFYRRLVKESPAHLRPDGWLIMELGAGQCPTVRRLIQAQSNLQEHVRVRDYAGLERIIVARRCV